jgi:cysteinyl-tRNA synthetase
MMQAHYRSTLDFSSDALNAAEKGFYRLQEAISLLPDLPSGKESSWDVNVWEEKCYAAMNDDFNTPILIANLFDAAKYIQMVHSGKASISNKDKKYLIGKMNTFFFDVLGLNLIDAGNDTSLSTVMELVLDMRQTARANKDWSTSDAIRDKLNEAGIVVNDNAEGASWTKK